MSAARIARRRGMSVSVVPRSPVPPTDARMERSDSGAPIPGMTVKRLQRSGSG
ncbi:MAG: hypothetical protein WA902_07495 [Thermosynechococcaceae cyanobacterium]